MNKPIDLTKGRSLEFSFGDVIISVPELTYKEYARIQDYEDNVNTTREDEKEIVLWLLNRNTSGKKFSIEDLESLPYTSIRKIYFGCVRMTLDALNDPN